MAGAGVKDAGEETTCPSCRTTVLRKKMIPVLGEGGGRAYVCAECARAMRPPAIAEANALGGPL
ncbi:MAG: hypothetical protein KY443_10100 [Actinobacteria bacterium]|nr:hypothetical protein [Actinomycetota bacterium]